MPPQHPTAQRRAAIPLLRRLFTAAVALWFVLATTVADAAELKILCSNGLRAVMQALVPEFKRATRHSLLVDFAPSAVLHQRMDAGETFDVAILTPVLIDEAIARGLLTQASRAEIARSPLGLAMRAGASKPAMDSVEAFSRTLRDARSITYATQGASAEPFEAILDRLRLTAAVKPKLRLRETGAQVGDAVATGAVEYGVIPVSEILPVRGVELAGAFPDAVQSYVVMVAAVATRAREPQAAGDLIQFLLDPANRPVLESNGMQR